MFNINEMEEQALTEAGACVMLYDDINRRWMPAGNSTECLPAKVKIYCNSQNNTYRVVGWRLLDKQVVLNCNIVKGLRYQMARETFHQWRDYKQVYGLSFTCKSDADKFSEVMHGVLHSLDTRSTSRDTFILPPPPPPAKPTTMQIMNSNSEYAQPFADVTNDDYGPIQDNRASSLQRSQIYDDDSISSGSSEYSRGYFQSINPLQYPGDASLCSSNDSGCIIMNSGSTLKSNNHAFVSLTSKYIPMNNFTDDRCIMNSGSTLKSNSHTSSVSSTSTYISMNNSPVIQNNCQLESPNTIPPAPPPPPPFQPPPVFSIVTKNIRSAATLPDIPHDVDNYKKPICSSEMEGKSIRRTASVSVAKTGDLLTEMQNLFNKKKLKTSKSDEASDETVQVASLFPRLNAASLSSEDEVIKTKSQRSQSITERFGQPALKNINEVFCLKIEECVSNKESVNTKESVNSKENMITNTVITKQDLDNCKKEILQEMRKEMQRFKGEFVDAIRLELRKNGQS